MEWIITCQVEGKDSYKVFEAFDDLGEIDWRKSNASKNIEKGDIVYIYVGVPYSKIMIKTICTVTNVKKEDMIDDTGYFVENEGWNNADEYFRLKFIKKIDDEKLSLKNLNDLQYVKTRIQGSYKSENHPKLFVYIDNIFNETNLVEIQDEEEKNIVSFPSPHTLELIKEYKIHAHPVKRGYPLKLSPYLTIRQQGGVIEEIYKVERILEIYPNEYEKQIGSLNINEYKRLKSYIEERKTSFGFSNKDTYYRFYFLEVYKEFGKPFIQKPNLQSFNYYSIKDFEPNIENKRINQRYLFCNIAYMKNYDASLFEEIPLNGGSYVAQTNDAYEKNNFHIYEDGFVRGFVETKYVDGAFGGQKIPKQLRIENIDSQFKNKNSIDNVLVIFCAHSPITNKTVIVGWYKNAIVLRNRETYNNQQYNLIANYKDAVLLKERDRIMEIPRAAQHKDNLGFGQANVWYANQPEHLDFVGNVLNYINSVEVNEIKRNVRNKNIIEDDRLNNIIKSLRFDTTTTFEYTDTIVPKPEAFETKKGVIYYKRDRKIAMNALSHAKYMCECNNDHESFIRKNDGVRYTEAHHLIPMAYQGDFEYSIDIEENIVSLCSNCHNEIHYGANAETLISKLYNERKEYLKKKKIEISLEQLLSYYK